jgi:hypothetical protein
MSGGSTATALQLAVVLLVDCLLTSQPSWKCALCQGKVFTIHQPASIV